MPEPRCPFCNAQGIEKIASRKVGPALLLYCGQCGAIHGVVPMPQTKKGAAPPPPPVVEQEEPKRGLLRDAPAKEQQAKAGPGEVSVSELGAMLDASRGGMMGAVFGDEER